MTVHTETQGQVDLRVVSSYRHLGSLLHISGRAGPEMRIRAAIAKQAFDTHRRSIYQQPGLALTRRFSLEQLHGSISQTTSVACERH